MNAVLATFYCERLSLNYTLLIRFSLSKSYVSVRQPRGRKCLHNKIEHVFGVHMCLFSPSCPEPEVRVFPRILIESMKVSVVGAVRGKIVHFGTKAPNFQRLSILTCSFI